MLFALLFFIFSAVTATTGSYDSRRFDGAFMDNVRNHVEFLTRGERNIFNLGHLEASKNYLVEQLTEDGLTTLITSETDTDATIATHRTHTVIDSSYDAVWSAEPVTTIQSVIISPETQRHFTWNDPNEFFVMREIHNVITFIPGRNGGNGDTVMFMAHYDSVHQGAMDNAVPVAAMLETIRHILREGYQFDNDLIFVFTDAEEEGMLGAFAFWHQFAGFNDIRGLRNPDNNRIRLGTNFDSMGNGGNILMFETHTNNATLMSAYRRINNNIFTSSLAAMVYSSMDTFTDFDIFGPDVPSLNFANVGGYRVYHTQQDTFENANFRVAGQFADLIYRLAIEFGDFSFMDGHTPVLEQGGRAVFFSYLGSTAAFPFSVSYVLGGLIALMSIILVVLNMKRKSISWGGVFKGGFVQVLTLVATAAMMFLMYFLVTMLLVLFGALPLRGVMSLVFINMPLMIFSMILAGTFAVVFYIIFKKAFAAKGKDVVRGNSMLFVLFGLILSFALPAAGYLFSIAAILLLAVMIAGVLYGEKFREKFKMDFERLFLHTVPMIFAIPVILPVVILGGRVVGAIIFPVFVLLIVLLLGSILPYANYLKPKLNILWAKLPKKTLRIERVVTEQVEDKAKRGKFKEVTEKRVVKEKVTRTYRNRTGVVIMATLATIALLFSGGFGANFHDNLIGGHGWTTIAYDSALILVDNNGVRNLEVRDVVAMHHFQNADGFGGFNWDGDRRAFHKPAPGDLQLHFETPIARNGDLFTFTVAQRYAKASVTLVGVGNVESFVFSNTQIPNIEEIPAGVEYFRVENFNPSHDEITFHFPVAQWGSLTSGGQFFLRIAGEAPSVRAYFTETIFHHYAVEDTVEFRALQDHFRGQDDIYYALRANVIFKRTMTLNA